ncbi:hypothetical protein PanWU01x14_320010 [Parasponia andersonii]|uniref:Uncharacterized protein n=1 Tax=Parasponia andersonii TaxID=3476 RepID=A0A2P5ALT4_PARAD|nr:hypothetical protein PanWU01x14_320010 [Parasponia andersonii]
MVQIEVGIAVNENEESTFIEGASGAVHVVQESGHGFEGANFGELAKEHVVNGGSGGEIGLLGGPVEDAESRGFVVLATEGVEKLLRGEVGREELLRRR